MHRSKSLSRRKTSRARLGALLLSLGLLSSGLLGSSLAEAAGTMKPMAIRAGKMEPLAQPNATTYFNCETRAYADPNLFCYGPAAIRNAYGTAGLIANGIDGRGQTIVIIDAYGSPTAQADLAAFDSQFGLPPPPSFKVINLNPKPFDPTDSNQLGWADETSLDVQWSHAVAPGANIVLIEAASDNDADLLAAQNYAIEHELGNVITESYGQSENELVLLGAAGIADLQANEASYIAARRKGIAVFVSAGDSGVFNDMSTDAKGNFLFPFPTASYPASSPNVTSVGGTNLFFGTPFAATPNGAFQTEVVWNDGYGAGGGGVSGFFAAPAYQSQTLPAGTLAVLGGFRGYPDVSYNAGVVGGVLVYLGFLPVANQGFYLFGGTSAGAPQWAGVAALLGQQAGHGIGFLNNRLYALAGAKARDVAAGQNGFFGVSGYIASPTWDLATGWGSPSAGLLKLLPQVSGD